MDGWDEVVINATYLALCAAFNLEPNSADALCRFVRAYTNDSTNPQANRDVNICYIYPSLMQGTGFDYTVHEINKLGELTVKKTIPVEVMLTFYGPDAYKDAEFFWSIFTIDYGSRSPRAVLRQKNIVPMVDHPGGTLDRPVTLTEDEGTYKRNRADVRVRLLYYEVSKPNLEAAGPVEHAPEITTAADISGGIFVSS